MGYGVIEIYRGERVIAGGFSQEWRMRIDISINISIERSEIIAGSSFFNAR